jgi:hypothetical protein
MANERIHRNGAAETPTVSSQAQKDLLSGRLNLKRKQENRLIRALLSLLEPSAMD